MNWLRWAQWFVRWARLREEYRDAIIGLVAMCGRRELPAPPADGLELTAWVFPKDSKYGGGAAMMPIGPWSKTSMGKARTTTGDSAQTLEMTVDFGV